MPAHNSEFVESTPQPLDAFVYESGCSGGIDFSSLDVGAVLNVHTRYSHYRLVVVDGADNRALVTGGRLFPESTDVRIEGSTSGGTAIKPGFIGIGLRLELSNGSNRITTSVVQSMSLDPPPASRVC
ncbi:MAG TPA: hypothetical protein VFB92_27495 [Vicinamibacterales bacterium]|jgi:hypothetical protein|nr:hypothetical protein [Vicinamibacterales bacterium]